MNVGYCTNIHSGADFEQVLDNLQEYSIPVKQAVSPLDSMGIGLWFSHEAVVESLRDGNWQRLKEFLDANQLIPHTFNAFPFNDFHQPVVKHRVYDPNWTTGARKKYTLDIARLMTRLLPEGSIATISTLPLGWDDCESVAKDFFSECSKVLGECALELKNLQQEFGTTIQLCLEPEPGCRLQTSDQVQMVFQWYLFSDSNAEVVNREFLGVCHDICHSAVMFESQVEALARYKDAGINIGKVQISSAIEAKCSRSHPNALSVLRQFIEPRYLHQTSIKTAQAVRFFEDLPLAFEEPDATAPDAVWRTHFHVPINLATIDEIGTTQEEIRQCLDWFVNENYSTQFEVETYAWDVSPELIKGDSMIDSITRELQWLKGEFPVINSLNRIR